jgi:hypothetical protein
MAGLTRESGCEGCAYQQEPAKGRPRVDRVRPHGTVLAVRAGFSQAIAGESRDEAFDEHKAASLYARSVRRPVAAFLHFRSDFRADRKEREFLP